MSVLNHSFSTAAAPAGKVKLHNILSVDAWTDALDNLLRNLKKAPGIDNMTPMQFAVRLAERPEDIRWQLRSRNYQWSKTKSVVTRKPSGGERVLTLPTVQDRFVLRLVAYAVSNTINNTFSDVSYGFRPKRNCREAILKAQSYLHAGLTTVVSIDIENFFSRIRQKDVLNLLRSLLAEKVYRLLQSALSVHTPGGLGVGQGSPLSPVLGNIVLHAFDLEFGGCPDSPLLRYADDINFFCRNERQGLDLLERASQYLWRHRRLSVNQDKSRVQHFSRATLFGFGFTEDFKPVPSPESIARMESRIQELQATGEKLHLESYLAGRNAYHSL